jgi:hypothetical protein
MNNTLYNPLQKFDKALSRLQEVDILDTKLYEAMFMTIWRQRCKAALLVMPEFF